jgi:hypothetical protein
MQATGMVNDHLVTCDRYRQIARMDGFGKLRRLRKETARVQAAIDRAFAEIEPED